MPSPDVHVRRVPQRTWLGPLGGALFGASLFAGTIGLGIVRPTNYEWLLHGDWAVHLTGWWLFRVGPWSDPLGATPLLAAPVGSSVGLTDSIPLLALLFKPFDSLLPGDFQYFGLWLLLTWVLQGVMGALMLREWTRHPALQVLGAALLIMSPPLMFRIGHPALCAHWLLLGGLWLSVRRSRPMDLAHSAGWVGLTGAAALTHPYLALMVMVLAAADGARRWIVGDSRMGVLRDLVLVGAVVGTGLWQGGYFQASGGGLFASGFGFFSMNLLAPIMPMGYSRLIGADPFEFATAGQYEGYAYMGAGAFFLASVALVWCLARLRRWRELKVRWEFVPLVIACVFLTAFALGPRITAGSTLLFEYNGDWWGPLTVFRANGRMFWPVYYGFIVVALRAVLHLSPRAAAAILVTALVIQSVDLSGAYRRLRDVRSYGYRDPLQSQFWNVVPPHYARLALVPTNLCTQPAFDPQPFTLLAARHRLPINAGAMARLDRDRVDEYCAALAAELRNGELSPDTLYIVDRSLVPIFRTSPSSAVCTDIDSFAVCTARSAYAAWQDQFDITRALLPPDREFLGFYEELNTLYRTKLGRAPRPAPLDMSQRVGAIALYLAHRLASCDHSQAATHTHGDLDGTTTLRLCPEFRPLGALPPSNDTSRFRAGLDSRYPAGARPDAGTSVDGEGEAVWLHAYAEQRLMGLTDDSARRAVLDRIRQLIE